MDEQQLTKQLQDEGFDDVYVWEDGPDMNYPPHQHPDVSAHIILAGEMTVTARWANPHLQTGRALRYSRQDTPRRPHGPGGLQIPGRRKIVPRPAVRCFASRIVTAKCGGRSGRPREPPMAAVLTLAPFLPIFSHGVHHFLGRLMNPPGLALGEVATHIFDRPLASQMDVGGFEAHGVEQAFLIAFLGNRRHLNARAMGSQPAHNPPAAQMNDRDQGRARRW